MSRGLSKYCSSSIHTVLAMHLIALCYHALVGVGDGIMTVCQLPNAILY